jgi:hypothetical protein
MALRLRFESAAVSSGRGAGGGGSAELAVLATNESGAVQALRSPLALVARLLEADGATLHSGGLLLCSSGGGGARAAAAPQVEADGRGAFAVHVKLPAGHRGPTTFRVRIELSAPAPAALIAASAPRADRQAGSSGGGGGGARKFVPSTDVAVLAAASPVLTFALGAEAPPALPRRVGADTDAGAGAGEDGSGDGSGTGSGDAADEDTASMLVVAAAAHQQGPAVRIRMLEWPMAVTPGFGSIVWDCALLAQRRLLAPQPLVFAGAGAGAARKNRVSARVGGSNGAGGGGGGGAPAWLRGLRIVEIGCGTGFLGISAALCGARVLLTDGLRAVLRVARANARVNAAAVAAAGGSLDIAELRFGEPLPPALAAPVDLVLASEVVFRPDLYAPVVATLRALCELGRSAGAGEGTGAGASAGGTTVLFGIRRRACFELDDFMALLLEHFDATELATAAAAGAEQGAATASDAAFCAGAAAMSKTAFAPQLFSLTLRVAGAGKVAGAGAGERSGGGGP